MIRAVFFDAGNTLIHPYPGVAEVCGEIFNRLGESVPLATVVQAVEEAEAFYEKQYWSDDTFWASEGAAASFWFSYYLAVANFCGLDGIASQAASAIYDEFGRVNCWRAFQDVKPALACLKSEGLILGVISNWDTRLTEIIIALGLSDYFDFVISSASVGYIKPQSEIFGLALERAGVAPNEAVHVGDHFYADMLGAESAGILPILIHRSGPAKSSGCHVIESLHELSGICMQRRSNAGPYATRH